jgi:hypothetical protein
MGLPVLQAPSALRKQTKNRDLLSTFFIILNINTRKQKQKQKQRPLFRLSLPFGMLESKWDIQGSVLCCSFYTEAYKAHTKMQPQLDELELWTLQLATCNSNLNLNLGLNLHLPISISIPNRNPVYSNSHPKHHAS